MARAVHCDAGAEPHYSTDTVGLILLDVSLNPIYVSSTARQVICYALGSKEISETHIAETVRSQILDLRSRHSRHPEGTVVSGRRVYACRELLLDDRGSPGGAYSAIVFERVSRRNERFRHFIEEFNLTAREREVVCLLVSGLTSKEIAQQLNISAHTVKTYLNFVMTKLGVTTRSGIVGKLTRTAPPSDVKQNPR